MNNTLEQIERFEMLRFGWKYRRALNLDFVGCPYWLIKRRCTFSPGWGTLIIELCKIIGLSDE